jgi:hypothetical protein
MTDIRVTKHDILNLFVFQKAQAEGRLKEQGVTIKSLREELRKPMYANAESEYLEKVVKKKVGSTFLILKMFAVSAVPQR